MAHAATSHSTKLSAVLDKLREVIMLRRSMLTEIPHSEGRDFYPELAQVGKGYFRSFEKPFN
jgi:hypothetical protein